MFWSSRTLRGGIAPALVWTRQLASLTLGDVRNAGFASEVRIAATRHLPAAGVRSRIGHDVGSAPGTGRVSRATAGGPARAGPGSGLTGCVPLPVGGDRSVLPRAPRRGHRRRARARDRRKRVGRLPPRGHPARLAGAVRLRAFPRDRAAARGSARRDRKSTRLNSSHLVISYA